MPSPSCCTALDPRQVGDPVDTLTGAVSDRKLEFRLVGPLDLRWYRHYDSSCNDKPMAFGWGHTHDFDRVLRFTDDAITYEWPVGRALGFRRLEKDGDEMARLGFVLRRISPELYQLSNHGEPTMEFELRPPQKLARLQRLFRDRDQILFQYDDNGRLEQIIDSRGRRIRVAGQPNGRVTSLTLEATPGKPALLLAAYEFDERGNLGSTKYRDGHGYAFSYDRENRLLMRRGRKGFQFFFEYDKMGRCIRAWDDGRLYGVALNYKIPRRLTLVKREDGGEWAYHFDSESKLTRIVDPRGGERKFVYDPLGKLAMELDPNENATKIIYNAAGAAIANINSLGQRIDLPEDLNAPEPLTHRVAANPAEYVYGRFLDIESITLPERDQAKGLPWPAQASSLVFAKADPKQSSPEENISSVQALGVIWWPGPKAGRIFNDFGKLVGQRDEFGRQRQWTYDASGNVDGLMDFDGNKWLYDHGSWHLLRGVTDPLGGQVRSSYTINEQLASFTDAGGARSEYSYDLSGHLAEIKRHGVVRDRYVRDRAGNLIAKHAGDDRLLLQFEIGPGNLPTKRILASGDEHTFKYDKSGHRILSATKKDVVEFAYDRVGICLQDKRNGMGVKHNFFIGRSPGESIFFKKFVVKYERGKAGEVTITDPGGRKHNVRSLSNGLVEQQFSNGSREFVQYDGQGRCLFKYAEHKEGEIWKRRYHWSGEGELRRVEDNLRGEVRHEYDAAHRLRRRILPRGKTENYELDLAGNLLGQPGLTGAGLDQGNRLRYANGESIQYNDRNHVASRQTPAGLLSYTYDSRDQLVGVETPRGPWTADYDAEGRRTRKTWAGQTTEYYWNADQLIAEVNAEGRLRLYIYAEPLAQTPLFFLDYDSVTSPPESGRLYFIFSDQVGAPCLIEDESGSEVWRASIGPYGEAQVAPESKIEFNLRFPGHYFDAELGLHYNRFRYYSPVWGRYLQSDPWGIAGGDNLYAYCSNPLLKADVRGRGEDENCQKAKQRVTDNDEEQNRPLPKPSPPEPGTVDPESGMTENTMSALQKFAQGENPDGQKYLIGMRDTNPNSAQYQSDTENYMPKPLAVKEKTDPESGLVQDSGKNVGSPAPSGFYWDAEGFLRENGTARRIYGDHDLQCVSKDNGDGTYSPITDPAEQQKIIAQMNQAIGSPPGPPMIQHFANDSYVKPDGSPGRYPDNDETFTTMDSNGNIVRVNYSDVDENGQIISPYQKFLDDHGLPWPYRDRPLKCPIEGSGGH